MRKVNVLEGKRKVNSVMATFVIASVKYYDNKAYDFLGCRETGANGEDNS